MFCKQLVIQWWYSEWSWSGFRDWVICTNLIILQSWHPSGLVSSVPARGNYLSPCCYSDREDVHLHIIMTGNTASVKHTHTNWIKIENKYTHWFYINFPSTDALWDMSCSVMRVSGWHFLWPLTGLAGWDGYDRSWLCRQMGGRDPITTSPDITQHVGKCKHLKESKQQNYR